MRSNSGPNSLILNFLGEIEVVCGGKRLELPPSKKTRALLAYLVMTGQSHRRERLCAVLWDIPDDPRAALRWSLSKLRSLVDEPGKPRIVADRESVTFDATNVRVDALAIQEWFPNGVEEAATEHLRLAAAAFRGEFLEGLALPECHEFHGWLVAERERFRTMRVDVLNALVDRLADDPEEALPFVRTLVRVDPYDDAAWAKFVHLLVATGHRREAEQQLEAAKRLLKELGPGNSPALDNASRTVRDGWGALELMNGTRNPPRPSSEVRAKAESPPSSCFGKPTPLVGRSREWSKLLAAVDEAQAQGRERVILLTGEPGVGKSRLLAELMAVVRERDGTVLDGGAYEAESGRPYGPWIDALRRLSPISVGSTIGGDLAPLLPEFAHETAGRHSRDRLFGAVVELIAARAHTAPPVLIVLDDLQWCDEASAALLHYVARMSRHRPVVLALAARDWELPDNEPVSRTFRGLRHDQLLEEIVLGPLSKEDTERLVAALAPNVDAGLVFSASAGNPLFALEVTRSLPFGEHDIPRTLTEIVRDRIDRLPPVALDALRWCSVLGRTFHVDLLSGLVSCDAEGLVTALELLERHSLVRAVHDDRRSRGTYMFAHDVVRQVIYADISEPRRCLMHNRCAQALSTLVDTDESVAADVAYHAALAGEAGMAARACVAAGKRCLRLFANAEAGSLAQKGAPYAEQLSEPERTKLLLELTEVEIAARRPLRMGEMEARIEELAERALDYDCVEHARLGFHMLSVLRWERGEWAGAQENTMRAELVSRSADDKEHVVAMAEAARCLALLERDLATAEALALEAGALSSRVGVEPGAIPDAMGMLRLHQGQLDEAARQFSRARALSLRTGDRLGEFSALEHLVMVEVERGQYAAARALCAELVRIGDKLREGSEAPFARVLDALVDLATGGPAANLDLDKALDALRLADAKHRLAYALTRAAAIDLEQGRPETARTRAAEALDVARILGRPSEIALALVDLARAASQMGDIEALNRHLAELRREAVDDASVFVRGAVDCVLSGGGTC